MSPTVVGHCEHCAAVVNRHWANCLVCHTPLIPSIRETGSPENAVAPAEARQEAVTASVSPTPPLLPGWLVGYRDRRGVLRGGCDDRLHGMVQQCVWSEQGWTVHLTDGQRLPSTSIRGVTALDGRAWTVREHGYDGEGPRAGRNSL